MPGFGHQLLRRVAEQLFGLGADVGDSRPAGFQVHDLGPRDGGRGFHQPSERSLGRLQLGALLTLLGDVEQHTVETHGPAAVIAFEHPALIVDPDDATVGVDDPVVVRPRLPGEPKVVHDAIQRASIVGVDQVEPAIGLAHPMLHRVSDDLGDLWTDELRGDAGRVEVLVERAEVRHDRALLGEDAEAGLDLGRLLLGLLALGDVEHEALEDPRAPLLVTSAQRRPVEHPDDAARPWRGTGTPC